MAHESFKEFWKNCHFENMRADFLRRCQNSLRQTDVAFAGMTIFFCCNYVLALDPIKILTHLGPQNDGLNLSFVKDVNIVAKKMAQNGHK